MDAPNSKSHFSPRRDKTPSNALEVHPVSTALVRRDQYSGNPYPSRVLSEEEDDSSEGLLQYWRILMRHKGLITVGSLAGLILGFAVGIPMKPVFQANTTLEVLTINGEFLNQKQATPTSTNDGNYDTSEEQTQAKLLESSALVKRVIAKLNPQGAGSLQTIPLATTGWRSLLRLREPAENSPRQALLGATAATLKVRPTARTRVLEVSADSTDPQLAADFVNALSQEFIAENIEAHLQTTQSTSEWLRRELEDARAKLRASEDALQNYASTSGLIFTDENTNVATEKLQQLQQSLSSATAERISKQSRYELAQNAPSDSLSDVLNDGALRITQGKVADLKSQLAEASAIFAAESSRIQRLKAELESVQAAFDRQKADIVARIKNDYVEADRKEKLLAAAYKTQTHEVTGQDEKAIQYNILKRDVDSNRALYDTMLQQMKQASISSAIRAGNVRVVDPADVPDHPISPNFRVNSMIGLISGFFLTVAISLMRERADRTLQQPGDIKLWTNLIELGVIPNAAIGAKLGGYDRYFKPNGKISNRLTSPASSTFLITADRTPTISGESFRSTLTSMLFAAEGKSRPRVIVFTSANPAEGKTTVVSNLAIAAAEIRMKVLMIDADLRRPRLHEVFRLPNDRGIADLLSSDGEGESASDYILSSDIKNLDIIPAGKATQVAAHLLYSPMWSTLLEQLREEYDMILIDTPPMLQITDARVAAREADSVILVARSSVTTRDAIIAAKDRFSDDRIPILGTILNDWNPKYSPNGYYGYYQSHYYSNHYAKKD